MGVVPRKLKDIGLNIVPPYNTLKKINQHMRVCASGSGVMRGSTRSSRLFLSPGKRVIVREFSVTEKVYPVCDEKLTVPSHHRKRKMTDDRLQQCAERYGQPQITRQSRHIQNQIEAKISADIAGA